MDRAQFVAVGVTHIGDEHPAQAAVTLARRVLAGTAAVGETGLVKRPDLLRRAALEANGAAVGRGGLFVVDGLGNSERAAVVAIEVPGVPGRGLCSIGSPAPSTPSTAS